MVYSYLQKSCFILHTVEKFVSKNYQTKYHEGVVQQKIFVNFFQDQ